MKVAGIGFRDGATLASVRDALARVGASGVTRIALPARKAGSELPQALRAAGYDLIWVEDALLSQQATLTESPIARRHYATGSVAEAAALAAARAFTTAPAPRLLVPRAISADTFATAALATTGDPE